MNAPALIAPTQDRTLAGLVAHAYAAHLLLSDAYRVGSEETIGRAEDAWMDASDALTAELKALGINPDVLRRVL